MVRVMVNGLSSEYEQGKMAGEVAEMILDADNLRLYEFGLTGGDTSGSEVLLRGKTSNPTRVSLLKPENRDLWLNLADGKNYSRPDVVVDFTQPDAIDDNVDHYTKYGLPFVLGTTGYSPEQRENIVRKVEDAGLVAVIAPNMSLPIVAFQQFMMEYADANPNALAGHSLGITESHQAGKKDTSGTAKAMVAYFNDLGIDFPVEGIVKIRDPDEQQEIFRVPERFLDAHGWHKYAIRRDQENQDFSDLQRFNEAFKNFLSSNAFVDFVDSEISGEVSYDRVRKIGEFDIKVPYSNVEFRLFNGFDIAKDIDLVGIAHYVNGRNTYAEGTLDAVEFLAKRKVLRDTDGGKVYDMVDVLKAKTS
jgi:4-hydroxy-tetrahydrodipicolinate reductase